VKKEDSGEQSMVPSKRKRDGNRISAMSVEALMDCDMDPDFFLNGEKAEDKGSNMLLYQA
jgi:hypothetical protein